jgi:predicted RNA-binding protein with PIN domain
MIILGSGALRISAAEFLSEVENAEKEIDSFIQSHNLQNRNLDNKVLTEAILRKLED